MSTAGSSVDGRHRLVGHHPDVGRPRAVAHRDRAGIGLFGDPAEAAGHDGPAIGRRGGEHPQHERARRDAGRCPTPASSTAAPVPGRHNRCRDRAIARRQPVALGWPTIRRRAPARCSKARHVAGHRRPRSRNRRAATALPRARPSGRTTRSRCAASSDLRRAGARHRLGRKPSSARASITPEPGMLATDDAVLAQHVDQAGHAELRGRIELQRIERNWNRPGAAARRAASGRRRCGYGCGRR